MFKILVEIPEGWGVIFVAKKWKLRGGGGGVLHEIPSVVGVWITGREMDNWEGKKESFVAMPS